MIKETLLIELGTEELPPKALQKLATTFYSQITTQLEQAELAFEQASWFASPRRLAVQITQLIDKQADKEIEKRGPAINVAFDEEGNPSKAALGWAKSNGITIEQAQRLKTDKGEWLLHKALQPGKTIQELIPEMVNKAIAKLPIPKPMRWGSSRTQFIRPIHTLTLMFGEQIITGEALGIESNNLLQGHRFHHQGLISLEHANDYVATLKQAYVVADYQERKQLIVDQIKKAEQELNAVALIDEELLEEVTSIVEWPVTLIGSFDKEFLDVPPEPLIYSMKDHQKYFPVEDKQGKLLNKFIFVANIESKDANQVIFGNEKVIRPRLADAEFFFKTDKKQTLESRLESLESVLFQKQLGTLKTKSERIASLSEYIAEKINQSPKLAYRAGLLSKTDLMTEMVLEFPQVQGTMGKYYAQHDGEDVEVAQALEDQYRPRYSGDSIPKGVIGCAVAIADKIDTLVGIFGINQPPKGDKDPFALRRAAIGMIRIIIEKQLDLDIADLVSQSVSLYGEVLTNDNTTQQVIDFVLGRFKAHYQEQKISVDVIQAVLANSPTAPLDFEKRVFAVNHFKTMEAAQTLAAANKRVGNILAKFDGQLFSTFNTDYACDDNETELANTFSKVKEKIQPLVAAQDYQQALAELANIKQPIDNFFDNVMVMADDEQVKVNRLTLLNEIRNSFLDIADISVLQN
ncbi:glycine--tRNA ligase subunit beta [Thalassotalea sp. 1_MG-2023]|uniref:glycine--tRNA ligase subunit beta n=1 Tax=Thalassotalea sp. 1_MG-2023 TaxID=3062680 RepID=UPI0026E466AC|nr:glycine--tRNA ligase subunit beta [Thalassotalea sp. 1_MG-2023]MDO6427635.1 glycine--tRNA ligase subunit beta [Thalassotalea sp. 1_MG-2023]